MKRVFILAAGTALCASPAFAQETTERGDWEGGYIGGTFGLGAQGNDVGETVLFDTNRDGSFGDTVRTTAGVNAFAGTGGFCNGRNFGNSLAGGCFNDRDRFDYSIRAGYDTQFGRIVVGALVDVSRSDSVDSVTAFSTTPASYRFERKLDYAVGARGRLGYAAGGALFYATGGASYGFIKNRFVTTNGINSFANNGNSRSVGYTVGGGAEVKITDNITMGLEYLRTEFTRDKFVVNVGAGTAPPTNPFLLVSGGTNFRRSDPDFTQQAIRLTASIRF